MVLQVVMAVSAEQLFLLNKRSADPIDQIKQRIFNVALAVHATVNAVAGPLDATRVSGQQRMPARQWAALGKPPVGAGLRQPGGLAQVARGQADTIGNAFQAIRIIGTAMTILIEQTAGNACVMHESAVLILIFIQAAFTAAVTKRLPLLVRHLRQGYALPEGALSIIGEWHWLSRGCSRETAVYTHSSTQRSPSSKILFFHSWSVPEMPMVTTSWIDLTEAGRSIINTKLGRIGLCWHANQVTAIELDPQIDPQSDSAPNRTHHPAWHPIATYASAKLAARSAPDWLLQQIHAYCRQPDFRFCLPMAPAGTDFQRRVWRLIATIPAGYTRTYAELASELGTSPRAVGGACRANPYPLLVPCHRVVAVHGLGGFSGASGGRLLAFKRRLLTHEGAGVVM